MKPTILRVRLCHAQPIGKNAVVEHHVSYDSIIDGVHPMITFDKDPRFLRVDLPGLSHFELIPISNVATLLMADGEEAGKSKS